MKTIQIFISSVTKEFALLRNKIKSEKFSPSTDSLVINMIGDKGGGADSRGPLDASLEHTDDADIFILLLGETYGSVPDGKDKSYTHLEYDEAIKEGKNILVFPIGDIYTHPHGIQYSTNTSFSKWQNNILNNSNTHTTATAFSSNDNIDKIYAYINQELHRHILQNYNKNEKKLKRKKKEKRNYNKEHCIIFIHDLVPDKKPFMNKEKKYLDEYLIDTIKETFDFDYTFKYYKDRYFLYSKFLPFIKNDISSDYCIEQLSKLLFTKYKNKLQEGYKTVSFLGHGLGGIIAKKTIIDLCKDDISFKGLYISLATPHNNLDRIIKKNTILINYLTDDWKRYKHQVIRRYYCDANDSIVTPEIAFPNDLDEHKCLISTYNNESISKPCRYTSDIINNLNIFLENGILKIQ